MTTSDELDEEALLRTVTLQNAQSILLARRRAEQELLAAKNELERRTEELRDESRVLELLNKTGMMIASQLELETLVQAVTDAATELSGAQFGAFFYTATNEEGDHLQLYTLSGAPRAAFEKFGHPRATPLFGPIFRGEAIVRVDDVTVDPRYGQWAPHFGMPSGHLPVRSYLAVPVRSRKGTVLGALLFGHAQPGVFTPRAERLVSGVAAQAAVAIDNARLYDDLRRSAAAERTARAEAERIGVMKDEFLATLSHEMRTPLTAILGWWQVLSTGKTNAEETANGLQAIGRNTRALTRLIEDLLDMSRIIAGKVRLEAQAVELEGVVESALNSILPAATAKEIRIVKLLDRQGGTVLGDPSRLQQVVWNLLSNAIKFTPKGGQIDVRLERVGSNLEITVADTGRGIRAEFLPHIFERFRQADSSTTRQYGGLGLGLAIVKQLVELHGGTIRAKSAGEELGATFVVTLPHARTVAGRPGQGAEANAEAPRFDDIDLGGIRVLVVDDEPDAREFVRLVLAECGARVTLACSADEALEALARDRVDVIVSDIGMPEKDGYELLRRVRASPNGEIPAIAMTAFARSEDQTRAWQAGFQVHLAKPIDARELVVAIARLGRARPDGRDPAPPR